MVTGLRPKTGIGRGVTAGVSAGLIWGLAFPIPVLLHGWNAVTVTAGRYIAYGLASAVLFALGGRPLHRLAAGHWWTALVFAVTGNVGYYLLLVIGIVTVGAPATDLVIGCIPIVLALVGNWVAPAYAWRRIVLPVVLVSIGLVLVNTLEISGSRAYNPAPVAVKIAGLIAAAVLMVAFNFILEAGVSFNKSLAVVFYGWLPTIIFQLLVMVVLLKGVDPENFNPENPLVTNPASFINSDGVSRFVYRLLSYIDVFAVWEMALMGIGFSTIAAKKISTGTAITTVAFIYGIYVLIRSALSF